MIVRISRSGKSFKGLSTYLLHDPKAATSDRVAWTHTLNLANDIPSAAKDEMVSTARNAELLKQEAGIRAGGRRTQVTVKHVSLNWPTGTRVSREEMIEAAGSFLIHMGSGKHQTLIIAHRDCHPHIHLMINAVHPLTGLALKDGHEHRNAQAWALAYEQRQGAILCSDRLNRRKLRHKAPTRDAWQAFEPRQRAFEQQERLRQAEEPSFGAGGDQGSWHGHEWRLLKVIQREERKAFFATGRAAFSAVRLRVCRQVREEFRPRWRGYYALKKSGIEGDQLKTLKQDLMREQRAALESRRDSSCRDLRYMRGQAYRKLLDRQADARDELRKRQHQGLDSTDWLAKLRSPEASAKVDMRPIADTLRPAALGASPPLAGSPKSDNASPIVLRNKSAHAKMSRAIDTGNKASGLLSAVADQIFVRDSAWAGAAAVDINANSLELSRSTMMAPHLSRPTSIHQQQTEPTSRHVVEIPRSSDDDSRIDFADKSVHDEYDAAVVDVNEFFARKMQGLRNSGLSRHMMAAAIAALMVEKRAAIAAIKEKRSYKRRDRRLCDRWMDAS